MQEFLLNPFKNIPTLDDAISISKKYGMDLHPRYLFYWNEMSSNEFITFLEFLKRANFKNSEGSSKGEFGLEFPLTSMKANFEHLGVEHTIGQVPIDEVKAQDEVNIIILNELNSKMFLISFGIDITKYKFQDVKHLNDVKKSIFEAKLKS